MWTPFILVMYLLKRRAVMTYKNPNTAAKNLLILFVIDNFIANISFYSFSRPK